MVLNGEERVTRPGPLSPERKEGGDTGPARPDVQRPEGNDLLRRMKRVDPDAAKKYRQRSGE